MSEKPNKIPQITNWESDLDQIQDDLIFYLLENEMLLKKITDIKEISDLVKQKVISDTDTAYLIGKSDESDFLEDELDQLRDYLNGIAQRKSVKFVIKSNPTGPALITVDRKIN